MKGNEILSAEFYGKIQMLGIELDGYVLSNGTACLSERGAYGLLGFSTPSVLERVYSNIWPKELKPFISKDFECTQTLIKVTANCPHKGSNIRICDAKTINTIARAYSRAYLQGKLRKNQLHIGLQCATLRDAMADIALEQIIYDACEYKSQQPFYQRVRKHLESPVYEDAVKLIHEYGFSYSINNNIAIKKDITKFLKIPESTLNSYLRKHSDEIKPIRLDYATIRSLGLKARRLNGYQEDDVAKIAFGMDTEIGIKLKKRMFGQLGTFIKPEIKEEIQWREILAKVFQGFDLRYNYPVGKYRVDFFVPTMELCLECNGYDCHKYYNQQQEEKREQEILQKYSLVRFHHKISLETLFNGILQAKKDKVIKLYDIKNICDKLHLSLN